jgi:hypothetical protein
MVGCHQCPSLCRHLTGLDATRLVAVWEALVAWMSLLSGFHWLVLVIAHHTHLHILHAQACLVMDSLWSVLPDHFMWPFARGVHCATTSNSTAIKGMITPQGSICRRLAGLLAVFIIKPAFKHLVSCGMAVFRFLWQRLNVTVP